MSQNWSKFIFVVFVLPIFSILLVGCAIQETADTSGTDATDTPTETATPTPTGASVATSTDFEVTAVENSNYTIVVSKDGDGTTPCTAVEGEDALCIIDMNELDLWHRGYQFNYTLPDTLCHYAEFYPYFYNVAPLGYMPTLVAYATTSDVISNLDPDTLAGTVGGAASADIHYYINDTWYTHLQLFGKAAAKASEVRCPWNYEDVFDHGKNCCRGKFTTYSIADGTIADPVDADWDGQEGNCFDGPGMVSDAIPKDADSGLPISEIVAVDDGGYSNVFEVNTHYIDGTTGYVGDNRLRHWNVFGSNYYSKADHAPLMGGLYDIPEPMQVSSYWVGNHHVTANYTINCFDHDREVTSRIRVMVREWNDYAQFLLFVGGTATAPDTDDAETTPDQSAGDSLVSVSDPDSPGNDYFDWKDCDQYDCGISRASFDLSATAAGLILPIVSNYYLGFSDQDTSE